MLPIAPVPLHDELMYSVVARAALLNGLSDTRHAMHQMVGSRHAMVSVDLPVRLEEIHARLGLTGLTPAELLESNTLYPYYRAFMCGDRWAAVGRAAMQPRPVALKAQMGLLAHGVGASAQLRHCVHCDDESRAAHGTAYWHRQHHLPGVFACVTHRCLLSRVGYQEEMGHRARLLLPPPPRGLPSMSVEAGEPAMRLAQLSTDALGSGPYLPTREVRRRAIAAELSKRGWTRRRGAPAYEVLAAQILKDFGELEIFNPGHRLAPRQDGRMPWVEGLFSARDQFRAPMCHLLLNAVLFGDWPSFLNACGRFEGPSAWAVPRAPLRCKAADDRLAAIDNRNAHHPALLDPSVSCRRAGQLAGLSTNTVVTRRRAEGVAVRQRPHRALRSQRDEALAALAGGASVADAAQRFDISLNTLYRALAADPILREMHAQSQHVALQRAHRALWIALMEAHPDQGVKTLRAHAQGPYAWLYRHDRDWLREHSPAKVLTVPTQRVDWSARDAHLAQQVELARRAARSTPEPLNRIAAVVAHVYHPTQARKHADRLPLFWRAVTADLS